MPLPAGLPRRVGDVLTHDAAWSPTGEQIVYARGNDLYVCAPDGSRDHKLVGFSGVPAYPRWSPNGKVLRFPVVEEKTGSVALWQVDSDGTHAHRLLPNWRNPPNECCGTWTRDGSYYVFQAFSLAAVDLWAIRESRGFLRAREPEPLQLTSGTTLMMSPVVSADGKKLFSIGGANRGEVVRYDAASKQYSPYISGISAIQLGFSRDGQWVSYTSYPEGGLFRSRIDGSQLLQLTGSPQPAIQPQWSPDGKQIAFSSEVPGKARHIYIISADGGAPREITKGDRDEVSPNWFPDGHSLVFGNIPSELEGAVPPAIHRLDLKTGELTTLPGSEGYWAPKLSPDGEYLAAISKTSRLALFSFKTQKWTELTQVPPIAIPCVECVNPPNWSHDGRYLYYTVNDGSEDAFYRFDLKNQHAERVAGLGSVKRPRSSSFGGWIGLAPDDTPLALRDISSYEIYALDWQTP